MGVLDTYLAHTVPRAGDSMIGGGERGGLGGFILGLMVMPLVLLCKKRI